MIQNTGSMERGKCHDESARANNIKSVFCGGETERERERERERENGLEDRSSGTWATLAHFYQSSCLSLSLFACGDGGGAVTFPPFPTKEERACSNVAVYEHGTSLCTRIHIACWR